MTESRRRQVGGSHYLDMGVQPWDIFPKIATQAEWYGYLKLTAIAYLMRAGYKEGSDDVAKAIHVLEKLQEEFKYERED